MTVCPDKKPKGKLHVYYWWFSRVPDKLIEEYIKSKAEKLTRDEKKDI